MKTKIYIPMVAAALMLLSCGKERMAEINRNPEQVQTPDINYLFTDAIYNMEAHSYVEWFYDNSQYILPWTQATVGLAGSANSDTFNQIGAMGNSFAVLYDNIGGPIARLRNILDTEFKPQEAARYQYLRAMTYPILIYHAIKVTDLYGYLPYSQAWRGFYTDPPLLTPVYDTQEQLFKQWNNELKAAINTLSNDVVFEGAKMEQILPSSQQDLVYKGDVSRWIKFANSLRLKLAVRLTGVDPAMAATIAEEVAKTGNIMSSIDDDFYWYGGEQFFNFGDEVPLGLASKNLVDFMRANKDPRLRFVFAKNDFNSMVMQGFLDQNITIPNYILADAIINTVGGKKVFAGWKGDGEPWVRYQGAPVTINNELSSDDNNKYFQRSNFQLAIGATKRTFSPLSSFSNNLVRPDAWYTYPDTKEISEQYKPNGNFAYRIPLVSAAETQLYLAEMKLRGANLPKAASDYYREGVRLSVESMNRTARDLNLPYYRDIYDPNEKVIALKAGEIDGLLLNNDYILDGNTQKDLEKVHISLFIDRLPTPTDVYVTYRRGDVPRVGSTIWPRGNFSAGTFPIPRRFVVNEPSKANINYNNTMKAYQEQGFTVGTNSPAILSVQRIWYDK